jgi:hypothetical protein
MFTRYFTLAVPKGDVTQSAIDSLIEAGKERHSFREALLRLKEEGRLVPALVRLGAHTSDLDLSLAQNIITGLMDVGDALTGTGQGLFVLQPSDTIVHVTNEYLKREKDVKKRGQVLMNAISDTEGLFIPTLIVSREMDRNEQDANFNLHLLDSEDLSRAKSICVAKLEEASSNERLLGAYLGFYLHQWQKFDGADPPKKYAETITGSLNGSLRFLHGCIHEVRSQTSHSPEVESRWEIDLNNLASFVDVDRLKLVLEPVLTPDVQPEHREMVDVYEKEIKAFKRALERRARGIANDAFRDEDEV